MIVQKHGGSSFDKFIERNKKFWDKRPLTPGPGGSILVEISHNNAGILFLNLMVGRYLARLNGTDMLAVVAPTFSGFPVPRDQVRELALSFGATEVLEIGGDTATPSQRASLLNTPPGGWLRWLRVRRNETRLHKKLDGLSGASLRRAILDLTLNGLPIGDLFYDSYLYRAHVATINGSENEREPLVALTARLADDLEQLFDRRRIAAVVVSHTVYIDYGLLLRVALMRGIPVFGKMWLDPIGLRKYRKLAEATESVGDITQSEILFFREKFGAEFGAKARAFYPPSRNRIAENDYFRYGYGEDKEEISFSSLICDLGLDHEKKSCAIMAHMFMDCAHSFPDTLFDDYYQWLEQTLAFVAKQTHVNWLVRQHPYEKMVEGDPNFPSICDPFNQIIARYVRPENTIRVVPPKVATSTLFSSNGVTTVGGTAGLEFASVGVPCILAGRPFYADLGFTLRPTTPDAYFATLASIPSLPRVSEDRQQLAKEVALVSMSFTRLRSSLYPMNYDLGGRTVTQDDIDAYWDNAAAELGSIAPEDDPLLRNLERMWQRDDTILVDYHAS